MESTDIFRFPQGIPGFAECKEFRLIRDGDSPLAQLVFTGDEKIGFILIPPSVFFPEYKMELDEESKNALRVTGEHSSEDFEIWTILTNHTDLKKITVNLKAPIILHKGEQLGVQQIIEQEAYSFRHPLPLISGQEGKVE